MEYPTKVAFGFLIALFVGSLAVLAVFLYVRSVKKMVTVNITFTKTEDFELNVNDEYIIVIDLTSKAKKAFEFTTVAFDLYGGGKTYRRTGNSSDEDVIIVLQPGVAFKLTINLKLKNLGVLMEKVKCQLGFKYGYYTGVIDCEGSLIK